MSTATENSKEEAGFYEPYAEFAKNVRTWFIAYGIGVPVLLLSNADCWKLVTASGEARSIGMLFLAGVAVQVTIALFYKAAMWQLYCAESTPSRKESRLYKLADWLSEQYLLEFGLDVATLGLFGWATVKALILIT